jgi:hypothetical protein
MSEKDPKTPPPPPRPHGQPDRRALLEAFKDVVKSEADKQGPGAATARPPKSRTALLVTLAVVLLIAFFLRDQWLVSTSLPLETPEVREASLKLVTAKAARRIELYQHSHDGALPDPVTLAGDLPRGMRYQADASGHYTLVMSEDRDSVVYQSSDSLAAFIGNSYDVIRKRSKP